MLSKKERYESLLKQIESLLTQDDQDVSNFSNFCALIIGEFSHHWVGFYFVDDTRKELYLGPFQGPLACTKIPFGKGVCGTAWETGLTQVVEDVHQFEGHIACSSLTNSEIVIPLRKQDKIVGVLDIDSIEFSQFDNIDKEYLEKACDLLMSVIG